MTFLISREGIRNLRHFLFDQRRPVLHMLKAMFLDVSLMLAEALDHLVIRDVGLLPLLMNVACQMNHPRRNKLLRTRDETLLKGFLDETPTLLCNKIWRNTMLWSRNGLNVLRKNGLLVQKVFFRSVIQEILFLTTFTCTSNFLVIAGNFEKIVTYVGFIC